MRTKGATSCIAVRLEDLNKLLQPQAIVFISRRQADELGILGKPVFSTDENIKAAGNQPAIEETVSMREIE